MNAKDGHKDIVCESERCRGGSMRGKDKHGAKNTSPPYELLVYWHRRRDAEIKLWACYCYFIIPFPEFFGTAYAAQPRRGKASLSRWLLEKNKSAKSTHWEQITESNIKITSLRIYNPIKHEDGPGALSSTVNMPTTMLLKHEEVVKRQIIKYWTSVWCPHERFRSYLQDKQQNIFIVRFPSFLLSTVRHCHKSRPCWQLDVHPTPHTGAEANILYIHRCRIKWDSVLVGRETDKCNRMMFTGGSTQHGHNKV